MVENKAESKWIKYIFKEYAKGTPLKIVKDVLEENQVQTRRGHNQWSMGSLQAIIRNETYIGIDTFIDIKSKETITLNRPDKGLLIENNIWRELENFSSGSVCLVLASEVFSEEEYIRDFDEFLDYNSK